MQKVRPKDAFTPEPDLLSHALRGVVVRVGDQHETL